MSDYSNKLQHFHIPGSIHGLTFSCYRNRLFLKYDRTRMYFIDSLNSSLIKYNIALIAFVIMPNHVHLIVKPMNDVYSIPEFLKSVKQSVARKAIGYLRRCNSGILKFMETGRSDPKWRFWQVRCGYDRNLRDEMELVKFIDYVHRNPVKEKLVGKATDWKWSSARDWILNEEGMLKIEKNIW
jgi:putative transposase